MAMDIKSKYLVWLGLAGPTAYMAMWLKHPITELLIPIGAAVIAFVTFNDNFKDIAELQIVRPKDLGLSQNVQSPLPPWEQGQDGVPRPRYAVPGNDNIRGGL